MWQAEQHLTIAIEIEPKWNVDKEIALQLGRHYT